MGYSANGRNAVFISSNCRFCISRERATNRATVLSNKPSQMRGLERIDRGARCISGTDFDRGSPQLSRSGNYASVVIIGAKNGSQSHREDRLNCFGTVGVTVCARSFAGSRSATIRGCFDAIHGHSWSVRMRDSSVPLKRENSRVNCDQNCDRQRFPCRFQITANRANAAPVIGSTCCESGGIW